MLVIPALLSLKSQIMEFESEELNILITTVIRRIQGDPSEIVAKTGKKLLLELQKCYPTSFRRNYIESMEPGIKRSICEAIIENREEDLKAILSNRVQ